MERGLYIAASGMVAEMARQDQIANDLANASTPGYKADRSATSAFGELLVTNTQGDQVGTLSAGTEIGQQVTDLRAMALKDTGEPLDLAIEGDGFFAVQTPEGVRYTRNGAFRAGQGGALVDQLGNQVLGQNGGPVRVTAGGTVTARDVGVFTVNGPRKVGDTYFTGAAGGAATGRARTGALEGSGVDPARAMIDMMASLRSFEAGQKVITTIDETLAKAATQVGSVRG